MGGCHSDLKHKEGEINSLEHHKMNSGSNLSLAEGKEPPSFEELCSRQQDLLARSDALKSAVAQQTKRRSFRSELADIVLKGPKRPVLPPEEESEETEKVGEPVPSTPRVKLSYRRPTLDNNSTPEMKDVVNKYFDTLEELKKFVVSDEIYLDRNDPSTGNKLSDCKQDLEEEVTGAAKSNDSAVKERTPAEPSAVAKKEVVAERVEFLAPEAEMESLIPPFQTLDHTADILKEESTTSQTNTETRKKEKRQKAKKTKKAFSCFSSEKCD